MAYRYSRNYTGDDDSVEGEVMDSWEDVGTGKTPGGRQTSPEERVEEFLRRVSAGITKDKKTTMKEAIEKSRRMRRAEQALSNPGHGAGIVVRRDGMLRREKPQDSARFEASKANHDHGVLLYETLVYLAKLIASGKKVGMELFAHLLELDDEYPEALLPQAELMTEWGMEKYLDTFKEALDMYPEMRLEDIAQAMLNRPYIWPS